MILLIDTCQKEGLVKIIDGLREYCKTWPIADLSTELLANINLLLNQSDYNLSDIKKIAVCNGPGPFTSVRIGVATANALSYALARPIYELNRETNLPQQIQQIQKDKVKPQESLKVKYSAPPNITIK